MKTAIIYLSRHGTTEKVAHMICDRLPEDEITLINLKEVPGPDLATFERIVIGTSVYAGDVRKPFKKFCTTENLCLFACKELGLFVCGMEEDEFKQTQELERAFPEQVRRFAKAKAFVGGEFLFDKMSFFEKIIVKKVTKVSSTISRIDTGALDKFIAKLTASMQ